jgi:cystathionine beta-lyase/cystathionine gamma-synthase
MGFYALIEYAALTALFMTGCAACLALQLRNERNRATLALNSLEESKALSVGVLKTVIFELRQDNAIITNRLEERDSMITSAGKVFNKHVNQIMRQEETIGELRATVAHSKSALERVEILQRRAALVSSALNDFTREALEDALPDLKGEAAAVNGTARQLRNELRAVHQSQG